jgi:hypothetical protein
LHIAHNGADFDQVFPPNPVTGTMDRVTLDAIPGDGLVQPMTLALAERIFAGSDDLVFSVPEGTDRPRQMMNCLDTNTNNRLGTAWPWRATDTPGNPGLGANLTPLVPQSTGDYSWLVTVTPMALWPDFGLGGGNYYHYIDEHPVYTVSVAVFYKRDFTTYDNCLKLNVEKPPERFCEVQTLGGGAPGNPALGGGDVRVTLYAGNGTSSWLDVKENEWMLLYGRGARQEDVFLWYRIVGVAERDPANPGERYVTLAGPDWAFNYYKSNPNLSDPDLCTGGLFTGVVGVYTTMVELDLDSSWTRR